MLFSMFSGLQKSTNMKSLLDHFCFITIELFDPENIKNHTNINVSTTFQRGVMQPGFFATKFVSAVLDFGHMSHIGCWPPSPLNRQPELNISGVTKSGKIASDRMESATSSYAPKTRKIALPPTHKVGRQVAQGCTRTKIFISPYVGETA